MSQPKIVCVVPTVRPERHAEFVKAWTPLFEKHAVTLVTIWDGDEPEVETTHFGKPTPPVYIKRFRPFASPSPFPTTTQKYLDNRDLFCRRTDACRNLGFVVAAALHPTHVLTLDDDVHPVAKYGSTYQETNDPIRSHLDTLSKRVPLGWMNTAHESSEYLRGHPYWNRGEAPVMLSHGVWVGTPDFDGETQLRLEACPSCDGRGELVPPACSWDEDDRSCSRCNGTGKQPLPHSLPYYVGSIPRGVKFPLCGMNVMVRAEALPYLYFAPMGPDCGVYRERQVDQTAGGTHTFKVPILHRFADIYMGLFLKDRFDQLGWACYTGGSTVHHTRASDAKVNFEQEKLGREWLELMTTDGATMPPELIKYLKSYADKRTRYEALVKSLPEK